MTTAAEMQSRFKQHFDASRANPYPSLADRNDWLTKLAALVRTERGALATAISADFGYRSTFETDLLETFPSLEAISHAKRHLSAWMRPERRRPSVWFRPARAEIRYQPVGVAGIIVPWNYPLYLTIAPIVGALAAGNRVLVKISEHSINFGEQLSKLVDQYFPPDVLQIITGELDIVRAFSLLPFDHLLFTGSTAVGREVMQAAARNLTPVTLELGGKSPALVCPDFDMATAAKRIVFGKLVNAGQTCIAPDYVLAPEQMVSDLIMHMRAAAGWLFGSSSNAGDYTSLASDSQLRRIEAIVKDATDQGANAEPLVAQSTHDVPRHFMPLALTQVTSSMRVMREEIFGPVLPIVSYRTIDEAIAYVAQRERPLAFYVFDRNRKRRERILLSTASGGVTINDTLLHIAQDDLPFGGIGASGMGRYHGIEGFRTFSQQRSVFFRKRLSALPLLYPPYARPLTQLLLRLLLRR